MRDQYRKYGRRKAGTWGKPHKGRRSAANRAVRTKNKRDAIRESKILNNEITSL